MIIFIYGPDTFRSREKLREVITQFQKKRDTSGMNVVKLSGQKLDFDRLRQESMTQGFLSPKKMIIIEEFFSHNSDESLFTQTQNFVKKFIKEDENNVLVFWEGDVKEKKKTKADKAAGKLFNYLKKQEYVFKFEELSRIQIQQWIKSRLKDKGGVMSQSTISQLAALVGNNLWQLANDIDKLVALRGDTEISNEDVRNHVQGIFEENIFALTDAIALQNKSKALILLKREIQNGTNVLYLLTMVTRQFRILIQLQSLLANNIISPDAIAKQLKLHPFVIKKSIPAAKRYSFVELKSIYSRLMSIDQHLKLGYPNPELLMNMLLIS